MSAEQEQEVQEKEITGGEIVAHLVDLAGYAANKSKICKGDPRIKAVLDVALTQVKSANILSDLLQIVHHQTSQQQQPTESQIFNRQRQDAREKWESDMRGTLLNNQERVNRNRQLEQTAIELLLQQLSSNGESQDER